MAIYLPKGYSLKRTGEELMSTMDSHFTVMDSIFEEQNKLNAAYVGDMLRQKQKELSEKISAQKEKTINRVNEIEAAGLDGINKFVKSIKPSDIVQSDLLLLDDKVFPVSQEIFDELAKTYKDNFTMTQAICKYAIEHSDDSIEAIFTTKPKEGFIKYEFPMTVDEAKDFLTATTELCRRATANGTGTTSRLGYALSTSCGNIKKMINMG